MKRIGVLLLIVAGFFFFSGCAVNKVPQPTGGSRADGTIKMSYEYGAFEKPQVNWTKATQKAMEKCRNWGYGYAEKFGSGIRECVARDPSMGCMRYRVTVTYQCCE